ncbi:nicotinamide-nucleotide adenylyltransferase [Malassezia sp. CBS 17886]|nr:nicotinamide-nucleotide adenylyltransferase [Malassezia sp. CBS 17886]
MSLLRHAQVLPAARSRALRESLEQFLSVPHAGALRVVYATHPRAWLGADVRHMAVLDASFNPPTRAHLALASLPLRVKGAVPYDAHMLIFSVRNADKGHGQQGDASAHERLEMLELFAHQLEQDAAAHGHRANVVVALVDEPLVFRKAPLIRRFWESHAPRVPPPHLYWLMGADTITRVFQPKYYGGEENLAAACETFFVSDACSIVCADRSTESVQGVACHLPCARADGGAQLSDELHRLLNSPGPAHIWYGRGSIELRTIPASDAPHSSTAVRRLLQSQPPSDGLSGVLGTMVPATVVEYLLTHCPYAPGPASASDGE